MVFAGMLKILMHTIKAVAASMVLHYFNITKYALMFEMLLEKLQISLNKLKFCRGLMMSLIRKQSLESCHMHCIYSIVKTVTETFMYLAALQAF